MKLVLANVAHHLDLGAKQAFVFLDKPQAGLEKILATNPKVTTFVCDDNYWEKTLSVRRPDKVIFRQMRNARFAMTLCNADWLLHVDADEFLHPLGDFVQELARLPNSFGGLWLENYERAFRAGTDTATIFDGVFRSFPKTEPHGASLESFFGKNTPFSRFGFTAHNIGKSFARNDPRFAQGLHEVRLATEDLPQPMANMYCSTKARILHFDGLTTLHWVRKMQQMMAEQSMIDGKPAPEAAAPKKHQTPRELQLAMLRERAIQNI